MSGLRNLNNWRLSAFTTKKTMTKLLQYIEDKNEAYIDKIIDSIKDEKDWLLDLGIPESALDNSEQIPSLIRRQISNPSYQVQIDALFKYLITDYFYDVDEIPLIKHYVSADAYTSISALYVFKCAGLYFCYATGEDSQTLITKEPEDFCRNIASGIMNMYEIEEENLQDEYFKDTDPYNDLNMNFDFNES